MYKSYEINAETKRVEEHKMNKLKEIKEANERESKILKEHPNKDEEVAHEYISYLLSLLEEKDKAQEETVTLLEDMVDEMSFLKSEFNVGDVIGIGLFSDADVLIDRAGEIIIKRNVARTALNTTKDGESNEQ